MNKNNNKKINKNVTHGAVGGLIGACVGAPGLGVVLGLANANKKELKKTFNIKK